MTTLTFQNTTLSVIDQHNQKWLPALEVGRALGYKDPSANIAHLYERNKDEFTSSMTAIIEMDTASGIQKVRIFSLRGCWLLGMRSHTKVAKDFRRWVLDILDKEVLQNQQQNLPLVENKPQDNITVDVQLFSVLVRIALKAQGFGLSVEPTFRELFRVLNVPHYEKNQYAAIAYDLAHEFNYWIDAAETVLRRHQQKKSDENYRRARALARHNF